jgi:DNA-binding transcriptional MerR regulator
MSTTLQQVDLFGMPMDAADSNKKKKQPAPQKGAGSAYAKASDKVEAEELVAAEPVASIEEIVVPEPMAPAEVLVAAEPEPILPAPVSPPVIAEIVVSAPVIAEPVIAEPVVSEPVVSEPVVSEPVVYASEQIIVKLKSKPITVFKEPAIKEVVVKEVIKIQGKRGRKSFKEIDATVDLIDVPDDKTLQQKLYYSISEVAGWFKVNTSLLRYWENEFDVLQPRKTRKGDRLFRIEDIKNLQLIYFLLRQRKFSIEGAKSYLKNNKQKIDIETQLVQSLTGFRTFLLELRSSLNH